MPERDEIRPVPLLIGDAGDDLGLCGPDACLLPLPAERSVPDAPTLRVPGAEAAGDPSD